MALTEKSFHQVKNILNRLDRSIDELRARRGTSQNTTSPQGQPGGQNPVVPSPHAGASQNPERRPLQAGNVPNQMPGTPASMLNQTIGGPTAGASPKAGPPANGTTSFGHANGSGQTAPQRPGAQFGRATPILPRQGSSHQ